MYIVNKKIGKFWNPHLREKKRERKDFLMTTEEKLRKRIAQSFKSLSAFSAEIGMPYTTLDTMLKKGIRHSSLENVLQVCQGLGISLVELEQEGLQPRPEYPFPLISKAEREHMELYRMLDRHGRIAVDTLLRLEYDRLTELDGYFEELPIAARSKENDSKKLIIRRPFDNAELEEGESEF